MIIRTLTHYHQSRWWPTWIPEIIVTVIYLRREKKSSSDLLYMLWSPQDLKFDPGETHYQWHHTSNQFLYHRGTSPLLLSLLISVTYSCPFPRSFVLSSSRVSLMPRHIKSNIRTSRLHDDHDSKVPSSRRVNNTHVTVSLSSSRWLDYPDELW